MKSTHAGYGDIMGLTDALGSDTRIPKGLRGRMAALNGTMTADSHALGEGDMGMIMQALSYVHTKGVKSHHV